MTDQSPKPCFTKGTQTENSDAPTQSTNQPNNHIPVCHDTSIEVPSDSSKAAPQAAQNAVIDDVRPNAPSSHQDHLEQSHPSSSAPDKQVIEGTQTIEAKPSKSPSTSDVQSSSKLVTELGDQSEIQAMTDMAAFIQKQAANPDVEDAMLQTVLAISKVQSMIDELDKKQGAGSSSHTS